MARFLAIYIGTATAKEKSDWNAMDSITRQTREQEAMAAWGQWMQDHQTAIVDPGTPIGATKRVSSKGIENTSNHITGYVLIEAASHMDAAELFMSHPHFSLFPGDSVEIMECLPMPSGDT
ncbi:hypothetical protein NDN13_07205 [Acinetobacter sp. C32I]|uniref:hypothetical protein n=1 Tax=Acinetobacter sp. C32I TaxID=2950074 RepID=UPI0020374D72|nr:hypothetical protein [Acinetobacter sp. C32I]USA54962.1 hypothetical protein NDN13_07205 [Acinetobacter sp. C32I]